MVSPSTSTSNIQYFNHIIDHNKACQLLKKMMGKVNDVKKYIDAENFDLNKASQIAEELRKETIEVVKNFNPTLSKADYVPFPVALELIKMIALPQLTFCDDLRYSLTKTCRVCMDLVVFKSFLDRRQINLNLKKELIDQLHQATSPVERSSNFAFLFELRCTLEALRVLDAAKSWKDFFIRTVDAVEAGSKWSIVKLCAEKWDTDHTEKWYSQTLHWRLLSFKIKTFADFNVCKNEFFEEFQRPIQNELNPSLFMVEFFDQVLTEDQYDENTKKYVFNLGDPSLTKLVDHVKWETRYLAFEKLGKWIAVPNYQDECANAIFYHICETGERDRRVLSVILKIIKETQASSKTFWNDFFVRKKIALITHERKTKLTRRSVEKIKIERDKVGDKVNTLRLFLETVEKYIQRTEQSALEPKEGEPETKYAAQEVFDQIEGLNDNSVDSELIEDLGGENKFILEDHQQKAEAKINEFSEKIVQLEEEEASIPMQNEIIDLFKSLMPAGEENDLTSSFDLG